MNSLETDLERARDLDVRQLADAIESIGFECTRCGACCKGLEEEHTATVFPDEVRELGEATAESGEYDWRDVARPMPYGLENGGGETFEWALQTDACGDCAFYEERDGTGACVAHENRPLICRTYPFSVAFASDGSPDRTSQPMGEAVDSVALGANRETGGEAATVRAHECEGLGRDISRTDAEELARALKERAVRDLEEAIGVRDNYVPVDRGADAVVVHDSEGAKRIDGTRLEE
ncbi:YkgJ family cysteine cluster protein [Natrononativus amylolyticus]|uniref:YkgJ family cysteine cluster protein n=1 Tax=Natrononativus amylolyticus TaxID=2963434 RepID=UPI0020CC9F8F|nr:YkgJ family cysteine cluster protein [Natrononativus amylolyticus]